MKQIVVGTTYKIKGFCKSWANGQTVVVQGFNSDTGKYLCARVDLPTAKFELKSKHLEK